MHFLEQFLTQLLWYWNLTTQKQQHLECLYTSYSVWRNGERNNSVTGILWAQKLRTVDKFVDWYPMPLQFGRFMEIWCEWVDWHQVFQAEISVTTDVSKPQKANGMPNDFTPYYYKDIYIYTYIHHSFASTNVRVFLLIAKTWIFFLFFEIPPLYWILFLI